MGATTDDGPWARPVFSAGGTEFTWLDVVAFARRMGDWARFEAEVREGVACRRAGLTPDRAQVDAAAKEFRYRRRLITAEETEAWLAARSVEVKQWMDHVRRTVLREEHEDELPAIVAAHADVDAEAELDTAAWVTGRCGGVLDDLAAALAERVAAHLRLTGQAPPTPGAADDALDRLRAEAVSPRAVEDVVAQRRLDWVRVGLVELWLSSEGAAREAALSLRHDGMTIDEVAASAASANARTSRRSALLHELDGPLKTAVLGAHERSVLGPVETQDGFVVASVESKTVPTPDDPDVHRRAVAAVLTRIVRHEVEQRVAWHDAR